MEKFLIASDIHGSATYAARIAERFAQEKADHLFLLGDIYNHGPRNPMPEGYAPLGVAEVLNRLAPRMTVLKGNCDSDVDTLISDFSFVAEAVIFVAGKKITLQHGDKYNAEHLPPNFGEALVYGHFHTCFLRREGRAVLANCGSVSLPKKGTPHSYLMLEGDTFILKDIGGVELSRMQI